MRASLCVQFPEKWTWKELAARFHISTDAVRGIVRSKYKWSPEKIEQRRAELQSSRRVFGINDHPAAMSSHERQEPREQSERHQRDHSASKPRRDQVDRQSTNRPQRQHADDRQPRQVDSTSRVQHERSRSQWRVADVQPRPVPVASKLVATIATNTSNKEQSVSDILARFGSL